MQKQYNQTLFVEVPKDARGFKIVNFPRAGKWLKQTDSKSLNGFDFKLPSGEWEIVNPLNEITEEQAAGIVKLWPSMLVGSSIVYYKNYKTNGGLETALESLSSLSTHLGFEKDANIIVLQKKN